MTIIIIISIWLVAALILGFVIGKIFRHSSRGDRQIAKEEGLDRWR